MPKGTTKVEQQLTRMSNGVSAVLIILSAITGFCVWLNTQLQTAIADQISKVQGSIEGEMSENSQAITRVELMMLMEDDPENITAIEQMARRYFIDLKGDMYMSKKYSEWAKAYGGDISIAIGGK